MREPEKQFVQDTHGRPGSRWLVTAAATATILYAAGAVSLGTAPAAAAPGARVVTWFSENQNGVRWFVWAATVNAPVLAFLFALLQRLLPEPHRDVFRFGAVAFVVTTAVQAWIWGGLALHANRLEPATARTFLDVAVYWGPVLTGATTTMIAPVTLLALHGHAGLPRWLGVLGAVAFLEQTIETITIFGSTGFTEPGGAMNMQLGAGLILAWLLAFSIWGALRGRQQNLVT